MEKLKKIREESGMSGRALARLIGIKEARYGHYETGRRALPVDVAKKIGKALNINWWEIYEWERDRHERRKMWSLWKNHKWLLSRQRDYEA